MKTITVPTYEQVSPANQAILNELKKGLGFVPNLYATFAHSDTTLGKMVGFTPAQILEIRRGGAGFDARLDALAKLVRHHAAGACAGRLKPRCEQG